MDSDSILGLTCKTHREKVTLYCEHPSCEHKFICNSCETADKSHAFLHSKEIIPVSQFVSSYYMHQKMAHSLLKHLMGTLPSGVSDFMANKANTLKMVSSHFEMQRQQVEQLTTRLLAEA